MKKILLSFLLVFVVLFSLGGVYIVLAQDDACNYYGEIVDTQYCDEDLVLQNQKVEGASCIDNFECSGGSCIDEICQPLFEEREELSLGCKIACYFNIGVGDCDCDGNGNGNGGNGGNGGGGKDEYGRCREVWRCGAWSNQQYLCGYRICEQLYDCENEVYTPHTYKACPGGDEPPAPPINLTAPTFYCGDGNCDDGETKSNCPKDCKKSLWWLWILLILLVIALIVIIIIIVRKRMKQKKEGGIVASKIKVSTGKKPVIASKKSIKTAKIKPIIAKKQTTPMKKPITTQRQRPMRAVATTKSISAKPQIKQQELENYIKRNLTKGHKKQALRKNLLMHGWQPRMIDAAFKKLRV